jgi:hypothetical protein
VTGEQLIEIGRSLARPCLYLTDQGDGVPIAVWGGPGLVVAPPGPYQHWLTIAGPALADAGIEGLTGCLSIYTNEDDCRTGLVAADPALSFPRSIRDGVPLFGRKGLSWPPIDAVFLLGPAAVHAWLADNDWTPEEPYNENFRDRVCPLYGGGVHAQLGGWHMPWPDGDWYTLMERRLVAWTFQDAEPWVEVWLGEEGTFNVIQRIT